MDQSPALLAAAADIARFDSRAAILERFARALRRVGVHEYIYGIEQAPGSAPVQIATLGGAVEAAPGMDPFFAYCCRDFRPTPTGIAFLDDYPYLRAAERTVIETAAECGMRGGLALATRLRGPGRRARGGFNLGGDLGRAEVERHLLPHVDALRHLCFVTDAALTRHLSEAKEAWRRSAAPDGLTAREREVLRVMANGVSRRSCAEMLGCSHATVSSHLKSAFAKLGAHTLVGALASLEERRAQEAR